VPGGGAASLHARYEPTRGADDAALRAEFRAFLKDRPRWGYRRAHQRLAEQGWEVNRKRVQRLWREEGLRVPQRKRKRWRLGDSTVPAQRLRAERLGQVWALDYQQDQTADGRVIRLLNVVDEFTREALAMLVERSIDADRTVGVLERLAAERGAPKHIRMDNGPELTGHALRDWCLFSDTATAYIEPGSPWQNPFVESFHSRVRDELLDIEEFSCLAEAKVVISDWQQDYNWRRPHSALGMRSPAQFRGRDRAHPSRLTVRNEPRLGRGRGPSRRCELPGHPAQRRRTDRPDGRLTPRRSRPGQPQPPRQPVPWTNQPNPKLSLNGGPKNGVRSD